ncbi:MAG: sigma-70 family RNA polymerase sigma factor [Acidobacteria bacterium]|nr:sigma-70 family RNA polymerase sigma factor [Acidobacteriota bacterium]
MDADRQLIDRAAAGDREAFDELVRRHEARVFNLARALAGDEAEDVAQEAFVRAYRGIGRFRGDSTFATWLYRVTLNVARTHLERRSARARWLSASIDEERGVARVEAVASHGEPVDDAFARRDAIDRALQALPVDLRTAVTLRDLEGLEYREIATLLDVPIGTVESRLFRARQRLRTLLGDLVRPDRSRRPRRG